MKNPVEIKKEASNLLREERFELAYLTLFELGVEDFIQYILRNESNKKFWLEKKAGEFFWDQFVFGDDRLSQILESPKSENLFFHYFNYGPKISFEVINSTLEKDPEFLIKLVRVNQLFLNKHIYNILLKCDFPPQFSEHLVFWQKTNEALDSLFSSLDFFNDKLSSVSPEYVLANVIIWMEEERLQKGYNRKVIHKLSAIYNYFVEKIFFEYLKLRNNPKLDIEELRRNFITALEIKTQDNNIGKLLNVIDNLTTFLDDVVNLYSFNLNEIPVVENEMVYLKANPIDFYKWRVDGIRYDISQLRYILVGTEEVSKEVSQGKLVIPRGKLANDEGINFMLASRKKGTLNLLNDVCINGIKSGDDYNDMISILSTLSAFSTNRFFRYETLVLTYAENSSSFKELYRKLFSKSIIDDILVEPFLFMQDEEFISLNNKAVGTSPEISREIIKTFSVSCNQLKRGSRYKCYYDVFQKPFIKIGDNIFCPTFLFANNHWFFSFVQELLSLRKNDIDSKKETSQMESRLAEYCSLKKWQVKVISESEANHINGDVDLIVEDSSNTLFIQLKRTILRLNPQDIYNESVLVDSPGREQLNDAEIFLNQPNDIFRSKNTITKWLVSSSFEHINSVVDDCRKVNYFELINALSNPEINTISDLINDISKDNSLKSLYNQILNDKHDNEAAIILSELGLPLQIFEMKDYKKAIFTLSEETSKRYKDIFDKALSLDKNGEKIKAIHLLEKCIEIDTNDAEAYGAIANIYADLKNFKNAFEHFEKALNLQPYDPMILRNYALALMENGLFYKGIQLQLKLYRHFPFLGDTNYEIKHNIIAGISSGRLSESEFKLLRRELAELE